MPIKNNLILTGLKKKLETKDLIMTSFEFLEFIEKIIYRARKTTVLAIYSVTRFKLFNIHPASFQTQMIHKIGDN